MSTTVEITIPGFTSGEFEAPSSLSGVVISLPGTQGPVGQSGLAGAIGPAGASGLAGATGATGPIDPTLSGQIYSLSGNLIQSGQYLDARVNILSGELTGYYPRSNPSGFITSSQTGQFQPTGDYVTSSQTGQFSTSGWVDSYYYPRDNPSGYLRLEDSSINTTGVNKSATLIPKGSAVYVSGAQGNTPKIWRASASMVDAHPGHKTIGLTTVDIAVNATGAIRTVGILRGINTTAYLEGDVLYLPTGASEPFITERYTDPRIEVVKIGYALNSTSNGTILIDIDVPYDLSELHRNYISHPADGDLIVYHSGSGIWYNRSPETGSFATTGFVNEYYYPRTNPSGFVSSSQTGVFQGTGDYILRSETGSFQPLGDYVSSSSTGILSGSFVSHSQTGDFYRSSNPSGFLTGSNQFLTRAVGISIDGGGSTITTGVKGEVFVPYSCSISSATILCNATGNFRIDVYKSSYSDYPPTETIISGTLLVVSGSNKYQDQTLSGWNRTIENGDTLRFIVLAASGISRANLVLKCNL